MPKSMLIWAKATKALDFSAEAMGRIGWLLVLYCTIGGVVGVFLRYVLNAPSLWIGTTVQFAMVLMACVAGIYALKHDYFVKLDVLYANLTPKKKAVCDVITSVYTFAFLAVLIWHGWKAAELSMMLDQQTPTAISMPVYPIKILIPISAVFVLLLVIRKLIHDIRLLIGHE